MRKWQGVAIVAALLLGLLAAACGGGQPSQPAQQEEPGQGGSEQAAAPPVQFPTRPVEFVVPVPPGGGMDTTVRATAPYWEKTLGTSIIIRNEPGANWLNGINMMYNANPPDGHVVGLLNMPGNVLLQLLDKHPIDFSKIQYIGQMVEDPEVMVLSPQSSIKTLDDLRQAENPRFAHGGAYATNAIAAAIAMGVFGVEFTPIGHNGSAEALLSTLRGDTDFAIFPMGTVGKHVEAGELIPVLAFARERLPQIPDVPTVAEIGHPELLGAGLLRRVVAVAPGTPPEVVEILRDTFERGVAENPDFKKTLGEQLGIDVNTLNGEDLETEVQKDIETLQQYIGSMDVFFE